jgi:hypothetical protein
LSERSSLPPALSAKDLGGRRTQIYNVSQIRSINRHPVESDEDCTPASISDTEDWLNWKRDLYTQNNTVDNCMADFESDIQQGNGIENPECPKQWDVSATPTVPGLIRPIQKSKR